MAPKAIKGGVPKKPKTGIKTTIPSVNPVATKNPVKKPIFDTYLEALERVIGTDESQPILDKINVQDLLNIVFIKNLPPLLKPKTVELIKKYNDTKIDEAYNLIVRSFNEWYPFTITEINSEAEFKQIEAAIITNHSPSPSAVFKFKPYDFPYYKWTITLEYIPLELIIKPIEQPNLFTYRPHSIIKVWCMPFKILQTEYIVRIEIDVTKETPHSEKRSLEKKRENIFDNKKPVKVIVRTKHEDWNNIDIHARFLIKIARATYFKIIHDELLYEIENENKVKYLPSDTEMRGVDLSPSFNHLLMNVYPTYIRRFSEVTLSESTPKVEIGLYTITEDKILVTSSREMICKYSYSYKDNETTISLNIFDKKIDDYLKIIKLLNNADEGNFLKKIAELIVFRVGQDNPDTDSDSDSDMDEQVIPPPLEKNLENKYKVTIYTGLYYTPSGTNLPKNQNIQFPF